MHENVNYHRGFKEATEKKWLISADEIIKRVQRGRFIWWGAVGGKEINIIAQRASEEVKVPFSMFNRPDYRQPLELLSGHSLIGLYNFSMLHKDRGDKEVIPFLLNYLGIEVKVSDVIEARSKGRKVDWGRVPYLIRYDLLTRVASEIGIPISGVTSKDLRRRFKFLENHALEGLHKSVTKDPDKRPNENSMDFLRRRIGQELRMKILKNLNRLWSVQRKIAVGMVEGRTLVQIQQELRLDNQRFQEHYEDMRVILRDLVTSGKGDSGF